MEGEEGEINPSTGQKRGQAPQSQDGAEPSLKQAACQCRFCTAVARRESRGVLVAPYTAVTDLSPEELATLVAKTGGGGDEQSPYMCNGCEGKIRRMRAANAQKTAKKKPATKKAKQGGSAPLGELPTNPAQAATRSSDAKDTTQSQSPPEKEALASSCASSLTVAGHR